MVVIEGEEAQQAAAQRTGEDAQRGHLPEDRRHQEKEHHHRRHAGGKAVDAVGEVHGVDAAHNDESRKHKVHDPVYRHRHVDKGNVEVIGQQSLIPHQAQEHHRRQKL